MFVEQNLQMEHQYKCNYVISEVFLSQTLFHSYDCNGTAAQRWLIISSSGKIELAGTPFCLDAGTSAYRHLFISLAVHYLLY